jgi:hypothetical protein
MRPLQLRNEATLAAGGALAAAIASAAIAGGGGGLIGATLARLSSLREASWTEEQLKHGGLLLWARPWDELHERKAMDIMRDNGGRDVHAHGLAG